jgi:hypothetical protein
MAGVLMRKSNQALIAMCTASVNAYMHGLLGAYFETAKSISYAHWAHCVAVCSAFVAALLFCVVCGLKSEDL